MRSWAYWESQCHTACSPCHILKKKLYIYIYIYILNILGVVRFSAVCISRRWWPHRSNVGTKKMPPTTLLETFSEALRGRIGVVRPVSVGVGGSTNRPASSLPRAIVHYHPHLLSILLSSKPHVTLPPLASTAMPNSPLISHRGRSRAAASYQPLPISPS